MFRPSCRVFLATSCLLLFSAPGCSGDSPAKPQDGPARNWNVFIITIDTLRADRLPPYGVSDVATPAITRLAAEGTTFRWAFSPVPLTLPAHASIFTGMQPFRHGVRDNGGFYLDPGQHTLATTLKSHGYRTGAFVSAFVLDGRWGLSSGFEHYYDDFNVSAQDVSAMARVQRPGEETWAEAERWLGQHASERFFVWLHLFDPHTPYAPPEPYRTQYNGRPYEGEIAYSDAIVGRALAWLEQRNLLDKTVVTVLSDHGEGLGEHDEDEHGLLAYDSTLRVPWIIRTPEQANRGETVEREVGLVDVTPTILGLLTIPATAPMDGVDLSATLNSNESVPAPPIYAETYYPRLRFNWHELAAVRDNRFKLIRAPRPELYDYRKDPGEARNLINEHPDVAARLSRILDNMRRDADAVPAAKFVDANAARRLSSLGYVGGTAVPAGTSESLPDPKDRVETYRQLAHARELLDAGESRAGTAILETIVRGEPELDAARRLLRDYWLQNKLVRRGLEWFAAGVRERPDSVPLLVYLGTFQRAAGQLEASAATLERALARAPHSVEALSAAAETHRAAGRPERAVELFRKAAAQTSDPTPTMRVAETLMRMRRLGEAEQIIKSTLAKYPKLGGAHYLLALIAEERGDLAGVEREYRTEISLTPWDHRPRFNLALLVGQRRDFLTQVQLLESIPEIAPDFAEVHFFLAKALLDLGDRRRFPDAIAAARSGLRLAPDSPQAPLGHYVLADIYTLEGNSVAAARELRLAEQLERRTSATPKQD